jgi:sulfhydrogenase subunit alpha
MKNLNIKIDNVTRVEGHGNIVLDVKDGALVDARFDVVESPRFFEVMLQGRKYTDASWIASRICGICAVTHTTASIRATEDAFGLAPSDQTIALRKLIFYGEVMQSHILHLYFLMAPDFFGAGSVISLAGTHGEVVKRALRMKGLANEVCAVVGGRHVHPVTMAVNGFTCVPDEARLRELMRRLVGARPDMDETVELFKGFAFPDFTRETEYVSLKGVDEYPFYSGDITSSDGYDIKPGGYKERIVETVVPTSTAKRASANRSSYMVGALARFNNNHGLLHHKAKEAAKALGLAPPCHNPYMINLAQVVETVHCLEEAINTIDGLLTKGIRRESAEFLPREGRGVGIVEAPRGALFHDYTYGPDGRIKDANCIMPTGQNVGNLEEDMRAMVPRIMDMPEDEITGRLKMLARAYDPCISCSTHEIAIIINR